MTGKQFPIRQLRKKKKRSQPLVVTYSIFKGSYRLLKQSQYHENPKETMQFYVESEVLHTSVFADQK